MTYEFKSVYLRIGLIEIAQTVETLEAWMNENNGEDKQRNSNGKWPLGWSNHVDAQTTKGRPKKGIREGRREIWRQAEIDAQRREKKWEMMEK